MDGLHWKSNASNAWKLRRAWRPTSLNSSIEFQNLMLACLGQPWFHRPREFTSVTDYRRIFAEALASCKISSKWRRPSTCMPCTLSMLCQIEAKNIKWLGIETLGHTNTTNAWSALISILQYQYVTRSLPSGIFYLGDDLRVLVAVFPGEYWWPNGLGKCCIMLGIMLYHPIIRYISIFRERIRIYPGELICTFM